MTTLDAAPASEARPPTPPTARTSAAAKRKGGWIRRAPLLPALIFAIIVTQLPFLLTIFYSLQSWNLVRPGSQEFVGLANYVAVFTDSTFRTAALNTILITAGCVIIAMVIGIGLAMLLDRPFKGRGIVRTLLITPFLIMPVAGALLWETTIFHPLFGLLNFVLSPFGVDSVAWVSAYPMASVIVALVWQWTPFMMLLVLAGLQSQPKDQLEASATDGASVWQTFTLITLPHLRRYIELGLLLGSIYVVNTFDTIYLMTQGGPGTDTTNLPFYLYQRAFLGFDVGQAAALGVVVVAGTIIVATVALRVIFRSFGREEA